MLIRKLFTAANSNCIGKLHDGKMVLCGRAGAPLGVSLLSVDGSDAENRLYMDWLFFCLRLTRRMNKNVESCE